MKESGYDRKFSNESRLTGSQQTLWQTTRTYVVVTGLKIRIHSAHFYCFVFNQNVEKMPPRIENEPPGFLYNINCYLSLFFVTAIITLKLIQFYQEPHQLSIIVHQPLANTTGLRSNHSPQRHLFEAEEAVTAVDSSTQGPLGTLGSTAALSKSPTGGCSKSIFEIHRKKDHLDVS